MVKSLHRLVDPSIPHLREFDNDSVHGTFSRNPVIIPLSHPHRLRTPHRILRPTYMLTYHDPRHPPAEQTSAPLAPHRGTTLEIEAFFLALQTIGLVSNSSAQNE